MLIGIDASRATSALRTGTENYSLQLTRELLRLTTEHQFRLYTNRRPPEGLFWSQDASPAAHIRAIPFPRMWTHLRLSAEMLMHTPDVLFVPAHVLPLAHPARSVVTVHDLGYLHYPEAHRPGDRRYLDWSTGWNARQATAVLADSQATRRDLLAAYKIEPAKVHVVYLGKDDSLCPVHDPQVLQGVRARYGVGGPYLLYVGTLQPRKNLARLIEAFAGMAGRDELVDVKLVLVGRQGWSYDSLLAQVERNGLDGRVLFPGYAADVDLPALYSGALAYVFPSLYEGFGMPVLEAQVCEVPVMTSNNSSLPEVAGDGALLVDPHNVDEIAEAMWRLASDEGLRQDLIRRGTENAARFSWQRCARETLDVLLSVGQRKRGNRQ